MTDPKQCTQESLRDVVLKFKGVAKPMHPTIYLMTWDAYQVVERSILPMGHVLPRMNSLYGIPLETLPTEQECKVRALCLLFEGERPSIIALTDGCLTITDYRPKSGVVHDE